MYLSEEKRAAIRACIENQRSNLGINSAGEKDKIKAYESFMKYGKNKYFWNEYIFEGYVNYEAEMIMLAGFPDIPLSMPHLAFCMNAKEYLSFTKGLSSVEEPDIWAHTLDDRISLWIDIGEPTFERMKKATRLSPTVKVYSFNLKSDGWWAKEQAKFNDLKVSVFQFHWKSVPLAIWIFQSKTRIKSLGL